METDQAVVHQVHYILRHAQLLYTLQSPDRRDCTRPQQGLRRLPTVALANLCTCPIRPRFRHATENGGGGGGGRAGDKRLNTQVGSDTM